MQLKFKKLRPDAKIPTRATPGSAGLDLYACIDDYMWINCRAPTSIPTGVSVEIPLGYEGQIRGRSGLLFKHGVHVPQTGTIDSDYRGELCVAIQMCDECIFPNAYKINPGDRIAQLVISPVAMCEPVEVDELDETERGAGGFGSTGI